MLTIGAANAQIKIIEPGSTTDVNGSTIELSDVPTASDMEVNFYVINTSGSSLSMVCTRTEVDGLAGTENSTCWQICPETLTTGAKPSYTVNIGGTNLEETAGPGDTITSFAGHYYPLGEDGCSLFKYEWADATDGTVYGHVYVRFVHMTSGTCTASNEEIAVDFDVYPNPANENMNIQLSDSYSADLDVKVVDVLGQVVSTTTLGAGNVYTSIPTSVLVEGVYFVTFSTTDKTILTKKIIVRH
jgi:hypothetical protein